MAVSQRTELLSRINSLTLAATDLVAGLTDLTARVAAALPPEPLCEPIHVTHLGTRYTARPPLECATNDFREVVVPMAGGIAHPTLRVIWDVYGVDRISATIENCLDVAGATTIEYSLEVPGRNAEWIKHYYMTRYRQWVKGGIALRPISEYHHSLLPDYPATLPLDMAMPKVDPARDRYPYGGSVDPYMPNHGGRPELSPYPLATARYCGVGDLAASYRMFHDADLSGSWPIHLRRADGTRRTFAEDSQYWIDHQRAKAPHRPLGNPLVDTPYLKFGPTEPERMSPLVPDNAHQPSLCYVPYLLTGDRYYLDELLDWAYFSLWRSTPKDRTDMGRVIPSNETRGAGWVLRNMVDVVSVLPADDPYRAELRGIVQHNLDWLDAWTAEKPHPLGVAWIDTQPPQKTEGNDRYWVALQQQAHLAWAVDHAHKRGFTGGTDWRDQFCRFWARLAKEWTDDCCPDRLAIGDKLSDGSMRPYITLEQAREATFRQDYWRRPLKSNGPQCRLCLQIAAANGVSGAAESLAWLEQQIAATLTTTDAGWFLA